MICLGLKNEKIKQQYKELYDFIKLTRAKRIEQVTALTTENVNLKAQILNTVNNVSKDHVKPTVLAPGKHLKESVKTIREIVEEANVVRPLDSSIISACRYTKHSHELLEYAIGTCPQDSHQRDKKHAHAPLIRNKQVTFAEQYTTLGVVNLVKGHCSPKVNILPMVSINDQYWSSTCSLLAPLASEILLVLGLLLGCNPLALGIGNNPPTPDKDTPDFDSVFVTGKMQAFLQGKDNTTDSQITKLTDQVTHLQAQNDMFRAENDKIKQHYKELHLKESVKTIREIVEEANVVRPLDSSIVSACRYTKHSHELLEYAIGTCPQDSHQRDKKHAHAPLIRNKKVTFAEQCDTSNSNTHKHVTKLNTQKTNVPVPPFTGVNHCTDASGSQPKSHVVQIVLWYLDSGCSKHMTGDRSRLMNFVKKFLGTVRFGNDHFGAITGYGDYVIGDSVISKKAFLLCSRYGCSIVSAFRYTKHSQELLEYAIGTCPQDSHQRDKKHAHAPLIRKKQVTFTEQCDTSNSNTHKHVAKLNTQKTNVLVPPSTGVNRCTDC
nr:integrase, catalytic region, zinc finger, CCHC-type, peptidase aspartic, catalytic [Tanacetum cinerariifolium]